MAILLGIDFETTGLNPETDHIIEVGAALWDVEAKCIIETMSMLTLPRDGFPVVIPHKIQMMTGIRDYMIEVLATPIAESARRLEEMSHCADYLVAHNAEFEQSFFGHLTMNEFAFPQPWIDTITDLPHPPGKRIGNLVHLAADHGFLNPFPHRALFDVMTMFKVLSLYDFSEIERNALAPVRTLAVPRGKYEKAGENNEKARNLGFRWNYEFNQYRKSVKDFRVVDELAAADEVGLKVVLLEKEDA